MEIVSCLSLGDSNAYNHLMAIALHPLVSKIWVVRSSKIAGEIPKVEYVLVPSGFKPWRFLKMVVHCLRLGRREKVAAFVSFNPIPYGLLQLPAALACRKHIHFGFIGSDWNQYSRGPLRPILTRLYSKANFLTVSSNKMREEMLAGGLGENDIIVLPNVIDVDRFPIADVNEADYDCIYVGNLVHVKRVDLIIRAFGFVVENYPQARLAIVGDGPLSEQLELLTRELKLMNSVDFVGRVRDVYPFLANSKMLLIASDSEGLPFVLLEALSSGLVPVSTPVGGITQLITNDFNGLLYPTGDAAALAGCIKRLLDNREFYDEQRSNVLKMRSQLSYEQATKVWDEWFAAFT